MTAWLRRIIWPPEESRTSGTAKTEPEPPAMAKATQQKTIDYKDGAQAWLDGNAIDHTLNPHGLKQDIERQDSWTKWHTHQTHQRDNSLKTLMLPDEK